MQEEQQKLAADPLKDLNIITLLKNPQQFNKIFCALINAAGQHFWKQEFQVSIEYYNKCLDMMDLGKNILINVSPVTQGCIFASLAAAHQGAWKMEKTNKYCHKAIQQISKLADEDNLEQFLKVSKVLVTLKFQHCSILSQLNQHEKALQVSKSALPILSRAVSIILGFAKEQQDAFSSKINEEGVMFSRKVYDFATQILLNLKKQLQQNMQSKLAKSGSFYFWQRNPQKNEQQLKKSFLPQNNSNSRRSILGVNKHSHWIDTFNIGAIMRLTEIRTDFYSKNVPMEQYLFKDKLYELVIFSSLAFFTIATQMRFIDVQKNGDELENRNEKQLSKIQIIKRKYGYQDKSQTFKGSQMYHLKAIEIVSTNIQSQVPFLTHLIRSYEKHYVFQKKLQEIAAINEQSIISASSFINPNINNQSKLLPNKSQIKVEEQDYGNQIMEINRQTTQQDYSDTFNDYQNQKELDKSKGKGDRCKKKEKESRNTVKFFISAPKDQLRHRHKSTEKLRKHAPKHTKEDNTQRCLQNLTSPQKPKKKKNKDKEGVKEDKFKKAKLKFAQYEGEGQLHVKTKSSTHYKFVFKKKK